MSTGSAVLEMVAAGEPLLGVSCDHHDAAAAVVIDGIVVAAAEEERFTRRKHEPSLPLHAIEWCLDYADVRPGDLKSVIFYEKPMTAFERFLVTHAHAGPRGFSAFVKGVSSWSGSKLWIASRLERTLSSLGQKNVHVLYAEHHQSHAAAAFYQSPFDDAAIVVIDGVGEWSTCSISHGHGHRVNILEEVRFPQSIGLFYSALTSYCGFAVNDGEYKLMGLAPYGRPIYRQQLLDEVIQINDDGEFRLSSKMFDYQSGRRMFSRRLQAVLGGPPREPNEPLTQRHADIARSAQDVLERAVLGIVRRARQLTGASALCLGGGVAHNCVASARVRGERLFDDVWTYPIAGDAGASLGAALWQWHQMLGNDRSPLPNGSPEVVFLGPSYDDEEVDDWLEQLGVDHQHVDSWSELNGEVARHLEDGLLVGWFQGRMEFGPRALGHRSILADPRHSSVVERLNTSVKNRESFRPFAPAILASSADEWFELGGALPYMAEVAMMRANRRLGHDPLDTDDWDPVECEPDFAQRLTRRRSEIPACTHVDFSARVQTVDERNRSLFELLTAFHNRTGCPVLLNTSFNRAGEPMVRTPADALRCFDEIGLDILVLGKIIIHQHQGVGRTLQ